MIKLRKSLFETNSSSSDRYDDDDDKTTLARARQLIHICLEWAEGTSEDRINEICDEIYNLSIDDSFFGVLEGYYEYTDPDNIDDAYEDEIMYYEQCTAQISWHGKYYPATRYEPAEYPEPEVDEYDGVPLKNQEYPGKNADIDAFMKIFKEKGWTEIIGISNIYADEIDDGEFFDNIC